MSKGNIVIGALAGIAAGAIVGLLIAPDKGAKTRKKISKKGKESIEDLKDTFNELLNSASKKYAVAKKEVNSVRDVKNISL